jgi:hypothetical protein
MPVHTVLGFRRYSGLAQQNRLEPCFRSLAGCPHVQAWSCSEVQRYLGNLDSAEEVQRVRGNGNRGRAIWQRETDICTELGCLLHTRDSLLTFDIMAVREDNISAPYINHCELQTLQEW